LSAVHSMRTSPLAAAGRFVPPPAHFEIAFQESVHHDVTLLSEADDDRRATAFARLAIANGIFLHLMDRHWTLA